MQWNIGGGRIRHPEADPVSGDSYASEGLGAIIDTIEEHEPDVITLQETHSADGYSQTKTIAEALGYSHWVNDTYATSHIDGNYLLGQGIVSRFPVDEHSFELFTNPNFTAQMAGAEMRSHDKGITSVVLGLGKGTVIMAQTLHAVPFNRFGVNPGSHEARAVLGDMQARILRLHRRPTLLQGDFNVDHDTLRGLFPELFENGFEEIRQTHSTTPGDTRRDHVLFAGMSPAESTVLSDQLTDHYPIVSSFV